MSDICSSCTFPPQYAAAACNGERNKWQLHSGKQNTVMRRQFVIDACTFFRAETVSSWSSGNRSWRKEDALQMGGTM